MEASTPKASKQIMSSHPAVLKTFTIIRKSITAHSEDERVQLGKEIEVGGVHSGDRLKGSHGRGAKNRKTASGILERNCSAQMETLKDCDATSLHMVMRAVLHRVNTI